MKNIIILIFILISLCINAISDTPKAVKIGGSAEGGGVTIDTSATGDFYSKHQVDSIANLKAPIASPTFTGTVSGITQDMITEYMVTPGNRTRSGICYSDTFRIPKDTILAGTINHPLVRTYGADTTVVIYWIGINYCHRTAAYVSSATDSIFIKTFQNSLKYNVIHIADSYITGTYSGVGFFPVAIDKKDQGARYWLYIPHTYTVGAGTLWLRIKYYLVIRKLT